MNSIGKILSGWSNSECVQQQVMKNSQDKPPFAGVIELKAIVLLLNGPVQHELEITFSA